MSKPEADPGGGLLAGAHLAPLELEPAPRHLAGLRQSVAAVALAATLMPAAFTGLASAATTKNAPSQSGAPTGYAPLPMPRQPAKCVPYPGGTTIGFEDDNQVVFQQDVSTVEVLDDAKSIFGATAVRIDVDSSLWQQPGTPLLYKNAVNTAVANGFQVQITLMPTPEYQPNLSQTLSYDNHTPAAMESFAYQVASTLGPAVMRYSIGNAVNNSKVLSGQS
jgi:hypothetical protein